MPTNVVVPLELISPADIGFRNRIINGNFDVWQRGTSFSLASDAAAIVAADLFLISNASTGATLAIAKATPPTGFRGSSAMTLTAAAVAVAGRIVVAQRLESRMLADLEGVDCVLSFDLVAAASAGVLGGSVSIVFNATPDDGTFATAESDFSFIVPAGASSVQVVIPAAHMIGAKNGAQISVGLVQASAPGDVSMTIGAVQFERGRAANLFEFRPLTIETYLCVGPSGATPWRPVVAWNAAGTYNDALPKYVVTDAGETFIAVDGAGIWTETGTHPAANPAKWSKLASKGSAGTNGADGAPGASGGAIVVTPAYANTGGQGDRKTGNIVVVTASAGLIQQGAVSNLVDGSTTAASGNAVQFNAVSVAGAWLLYDFGGGAQKVIIEATWAQSSAGFSHGVWQWQGSNDAVSFTNIGGTFTLGGSTAQVISTLSANQTGYRYYRLLGVSGTASGGGWNTEITFKVGSTIIDAPPPIALAAGTFATTQATTDRSAAVATDAFVWNAQAGALSRQSLQVAFNKDDLTGIVIAAQGDTTPDSATMPGTLGVLHPVPFPVDGALQEIDIRMAAAGTGRFMIRDIERGDIVWSSGTIALAAGVNQIVSGRDIAFRRVKATQQLLFQTISGAQLRTGAAGSGTTQYYSSPSLDVGGTLSSGALTAYTNAFSISYTLASLYASQPAPIRPRRNLLFQQFPGTSTPAGWAIASPFSVSNGLVASGAGGWDKVAFYGQYTGAHEVQGSAQFTVTDTASIFGLAMKPNPAGAAFYGGVVQVDGANNRLGLYAWTGSATAGTLMADVTMPALTAGHVYVLKWVRDELTFTGALIDVTAGVTTTVAWTFTGTPGLFAGAPGVMHRSGSGVTWNWVQLDLNVGQRVKVLFVGDSNMMGNVSSAIGRTWPYRFSDRRADKDMLISAVGSDTGQWINSRQAFDLTALSRVDFVVIAIGSNYASQATWRTDVAASIAAARAKGAEPILCTQIPSAASATALNQAMNADILGGYFGDLRILDIAAVVTTSGDRINWASGMGQADNIHISKAGHMAVDAYIASVAPYLLKDAM